MKIGMKIGGWKYRLRDTRTARRKHQLRQRNRAASFSRVMGSRAWENRRR
jgi:hypothetical protein